MGNKAILIFAAALCWMRRTGNAPDLAAWRVASKQCFFSVWLALAGIAGTASTEAQTARELVRVPANGDAVTFTNSFDRGELYLLKAAGAVVLGQDLLDAEYQIAGTNTRGMDVVSGIDVGIDIGLKAPRAPKGVLPGRMKWFGSYRTDHTYYLLATGTGQPLTLRLVTGGNRIGSGVITVSLFRLSPPAELATPLETKQVSFLEETVQTTLTTSNSMVYLLQASGDGKVGGAASDAGMPNTWITKPTVQEIRILEIAILTMAWGWTKRTPASRRVKTGGGRGVWITIILCFSLEPASPSISTITIPFTATTRRPTG